MPDLITPAVPVFFLLIALEAVFAAVRRRPLYRLNDALASLSCGVMMQLLEAFVKVGPVLVYMAVYDHGRLVTLPESPWVWVAGFFGVDFCYYWFHRASHRVNLLWGTHIPHHHSEAFNFSTALRQGAFEAIAAMGFYLALAVAGLPVLVFLVCKQAMTLYQFLLHTQAVRRLGPLERVLNTPSHHRVHHGQNPRYLDKNFGGWLIVWDKVFGTYEPENEPVVYGTVKPLGTWNPLWANLHHWVDVAKRMREMPTWRDAVLLWLRPPGWGMAEPTETPVITLYDPPVSKGMKVVAVGLFVLATVGYLAGEGAIGGWAWPQRALWGVGLLGVLVGLGVLLDGKPVKAVPAPAREDLAS